MLLTCFTRYRDKTTHTSGAVPRLRASCKACVHVDTDLVEHALYRERVRRHRVLPEIPSHAVAQTWLNHPEPYMLQSQLAKKQFGMRLIKFANNHQGFAPEAGVVRHQLKSFCLQFL